MYNYTYELIIIHFLIISVNIMQDLFNIWIN